MNILILRSNDRWHDYVSTCAVLAEHWERTKGWAVRQEASPQAIDAEVLARTDAVVIGGGYIGWAGGERIDSARREALAKYVEKGGALIVLHGGVGCFEDWELYQKLAGRVWEQGRSYHPPYGKIRVEVARPNHPAARGIADFEISDELYYLSQRGNLTPIAFSEHQGKREPVAWVSTYGAGRVFACTLGHNVESVRNPGYLALVTAGLEWARPGSELPAAAATAVGTGRDPAEKVRVGLIGAGGIANAHAAGYLAYADRAQVVAIAEPDAGRAEAMRARLGGSARIYPGWEELLRDDEVEAVDICLPHHLHMPAAVAAAQAGKHILVEKPIARDLDEADAMIRAADEAGVRLMVAHDRRYHPAFAKVKELIDAGEIGRLLCVRLDHNQNLVLPEGHWIRSREKLGGGAIMSCLVHQFDAMRWYAGAVELVGCISLTWPERMEGEVIGVVPMRFRSGAVGDAVINWAVRGSAPRNGTWGELIWISGEKGSIHNLGGLFIRRDDGKSAGEFEPVPVEPGGGHARAVQHFVDCVVNGSEPLTSGREGRATLEVAEAAYRSEALGRFVALPLEEGVPARLAFHASGQTRQEASA